MLAHIPFIRGPVQMQEGRDMSSPGKGQKDGNVASLLRGRSAEQSSGL